MRGGEDDARVYSREEDAGQGRRDQPSELPGSFVRARRGKKTAGSHGTYHLPMRRARWRCDSFASALKVSL